MMTLSSILGSVAGPSSSLLSGHPSGSLSQKLLSERNSAFYHDGSSGHHKGKVKQDKKHAILSALTLLAFLFFLNILQNCIREQAGNRGTVMMLAPTGATGPTGHVAKDPGRESEGGDRPSGEKRTIPDNPTGRKSRSLLSLEDPPTHNTRRQLKFIRNLTAVNNWTRELSQMSDRELDDHKLKTNNFPLYWKNNNRLTATPAPTPPDTTSPLLLRRFSKREKTSTEHIQTATKPPTWDYKRPDNFRPSPHIPSNPTTLLTTPPHRTLNTPTSTPTPTTPRNRRSDYDDYDPYTDTTKDDPHPPHPPTDAVGLDLNTFQTFPVYHYYNHRPLPLSHTNNQTIDLPNSDSPPPEIDRKHDQPLTTQQPLFLPTKTSPPQHNHRYRHPPHRPHHRPHHQPHYHLRNHHPHTYSFSPYRKTAPSHDHLRDDYYHHPPLLLAKYELQHDEPGFDLINFLWTIFTSFARPITNLVPSFAKDNHQQPPQCYDLLVCEAQRASRFMGPTAEALATTVGTLLTWAATEDTRQTVLDAINAGRENTCQQQIRDCEERSGGKSAMTVIAQVMEMKLR